MSKVIDEIMGAFKNLGETTGKRGLYPFEEIKEIRDAISQLGFGQKFNTETALSTRKVIVEKWKKVQEPFLGEFDREEPTYFSSPFKKEI